MYLIYNGVNKAHIIESASYISTLGLESRGYILALGRFVEEKGFHNLIDAYLESAAKDHYPLVIAGDADHATKYSIALKKKAKNSGVILPEWLRVIIWLNYIRIPDYLCCLHFMKVCLFPY